MKLVLRLSLIAMLLAAFAVPSHAYRFQSGTPETGTEITLASNGTTLTDEQINDLLAAAAEDSVPSKPSGSVMPSLGTGPWLFIFGIVIAIVRLAFWCVTLSRGAVRVSRGASAAISNVSSYGSSNIDEEGVISEKMEQRIAQAAATYASGNNVTQGSFQSTSVPGGFGRRN